MVFERPYSNYGNLKPLMENAIKKAITRVAADALRAGEKTGFSVLPSPFVKKWCDCKGGSVSGVEEIYFC
ncbi:TPA: hypothetical protein HA318_03280 [Candidatus Micrarchaeota archaeon]|nr:MAG: hypothetical protein AUJ65_05595 [Candidatus Micrarchaeota archaeon CG1_02_51_15]HII38998.1 hypothetical protein [Candidatus Micrarchaeota archaeon]